MVAFVNVPWPQPDPDQVLDLLHSYNFGPKIDPSRLLAEVSAEDARIFAAAGILGTPDHPDVPGVDFSEFSGVVTDNVKDGFLVTAYLKGKVIARADFREPVDTVAFWDSAVS